MSNLARFTPESLQGYQRSWLPRDVIAGVTLAAVAIPETMGYTSIAQTPVVTGLYTVIFPTLLFALLGSSRLLVVGADSATAAILAAGLAGSGHRRAPAELGRMGGLDQPGRVGLRRAADPRAAAQARLPRGLPEPSVLVGFLTGVGIQVFAGQIPDMLGIPKGTGNWFEQQWSTITHLGDANVWTVAFAVGALVIIVGLQAVPAQGPRRRRGRDLVDHPVQRARRLARTASRSSAPSRAASRRSACRRGSPGATSRKVLGIAFSCFVLIIAQSAATSRSFAMKHSQRVDVNRDIVGLSGANLAAGLTGTFVVNGSPTKTQILDEQKGRTQVANMTMSLVVLVVVLFLTGLLTDMPKAVLARDRVPHRHRSDRHQGLRRILAGTTQRVRHRRGDRVVVFAVGVEQGIVLAIVLSILEIIRRAYAPKDFLVGVDARGRPRPTSAPSPGTRACPDCWCSASTPSSSSPTPAGSPTTSRAWSAAPDPVRWLVLDCSSLDDVDYSASLTLAGLIDSLHSDGRVFALAGADPAAARHPGELRHPDRFDNTHIYSTVADAVAAFRNAPAASTSQSGPEPTP